MSEKQYKCVHPIVVHHTDGKVDGCPLWAALSALLKFQFPQDCLSDDGDFKNDDTCEWLTMGIIEREEHGKEEG